MSLLDSILGGITQASTAVRQVATDFVNVKKDLNGSPVTVPAVIYPPSPSQGPVPVGTQPDQRTGQGQVQDTNRHVIYMLGGLGVALGLILVLRR